MANIITACRIVCSAVLLFLPALSPAFYTVYLIGGFTDMIDGTIARKMGTESAFGAKLDSAADFYALWQQSRRFRRGIISGRDRRSDRISEGR